MRLDQYPVDPLFRVEVVSATPNPQQAIWAAMHQDYSEGFVYDSRESWPDERRAGEICVKRLLAGERGHYGPLEHAQIVFNAGWYPHSVMQQARTHRVGVSFDVQSGRYTGDRIVKYASTYKGDCVQDYRSSPDAPIVKDLERLYYLRQPGRYDDRQGHKYEYTPEQRWSDLEYCYYNTIEYVKGINQGRSEEHARAKLCFDFRQHFVVSFSLRALLHFLDLRGKPDAQLEIRQLCGLIYPHLEAWAPEFAAWYSEARLGKGRLAP